VALIAYPNVRSPRAQTGINQPEAEPTPTIVLAKGSITQVLGWLDQHGTE
jgi:hypothetical protein